MRPGAWSSARAPTGWRCSSSTARSTTTGLPEGKARTGRGRRGLRTPGGRGGDGPAMRPREELPATEYVDSHGRPKRVRYWRMRVEGGELSFDHEVDDARWSSATDAAGAPHIRSATSTCCVTPSPRRRAARSFTRPALTLGASASGRRLPSWFGAGRPARETCRARAPAGSGRRSSSPRTRSAGGTAAGRCRSD